MPDYIFGKTQPPHKRWPIAWYNPWVLLRSAREMLSTSDQIRNLDRREMYSPHLRLIQVAEEKRDDDFWWDFVSDMGDGGNATYTVAREMQKDSLACVVSADLQTTESLPEVFPSGELLVLGGDLAYPGSSVEEYQYRLTEMWIAASSNPRVQQNRDSLKPSLVIPQNHDWFDNISTFTRYFVDTRRDEIGLTKLSSETEPDVTPIGTRKLQKQSYFAARLPNNWIILGFDFALVADIDRQQFAAFYKLFHSGQITQQDNLILLYPEPYWSRHLGDDAREGYPKRYQRLEAIMLKLGCRIRMRIAGDLHHYARETAKPDQQFNYDDMLVIAGGGGAFLHPTHTCNSSKIKELSLDCEEGAMTEDLRERVRIGVVKDITDGPVRRYTEKKFYPSQSASRWLLIKNIGSFFRSTANIYKQLHDCKTLGERATVALSAIVQGNVMFPIMLGILLLGAMLTDSLIPGIIVTLLFAAISHEKSPGMAVVGGLAGLGLVLLMENHPSNFIKPAFLSENFHWNMGEYSWKCVLFFYCFIVAGLFTGIYFSLCSLFGFLPNNAFSPLSYEGYKSFVRFRIDREGRLHGYVWGIDDVHRYWVNNPESEQPLWVEKDKNKKAKWEIKDVFVLDK